MPLLDFWDYQDFDERIRFIDFLTKFCFNCVKLSIEFFMEEIKSAVRQKYEYK